MRAIFLLFLTTVVLLITGCRIEDNELSGDIIVWYGFKGVQEPALEAMLVQFSELNPDVTVITAAIPEAQLRQRFESAAAQGLGPDVVLASARLSASWAERNLIRSADHLLGNGGFGANVMQGVTFGENVYAVPVAVRPNALYYNRNRVASPPASIDEWSALADQGATAAVNTRFESAFWGIQAMGGSFFDESGAIVLAPDSMADWLLWLLDAQGKGSFLLARDTGILRTSFLEGRAAFLIESPDFLSQANEALGADTVGVAQLPAGTDSSAGPLLDIEALMLNSASAERQRIIADALVLFLTNPEQSARLLRETGRVPASRRVQVDPRFYPQLAGFASQLNAGVAAPPEVDLEVLTSLGGAAIANALTGVQEPGEAVCEFGARLAEAEVPFDEAGWRAYCP